MTFDGIIALAAKARADLLRVQAIPGLTDVDDAECRCLIAEVDELEQRFRDMCGVPGHLRAWMVGLRALLARGRDIGQKYWQ